MRSRFTLLTAALILAGPGPAGADEKGKEKEKAEAARKAEGAKKDAEAKKKAKEAEKEKEAQKAKKAAQPAAKPEAAAAATAPGKPATPAASAPADATSAKPTAPAPAAPAKAPTPVAPAAAPTQAPAAQAAAPLPPPPATATTAPAASLLWLGMGEDLVGPRNHGRPDRKPDGVFRLAARLAPGQTVRSISVYSTNADGAPAGGQVWHSENARFWILGVVRDGKQLNNRHVSALGAVAGPATFDLHCADSGHFKPGQWFAAELVLADGKKLVSRAQVPLAPAADALPVATAAAVASPQPGPAPSSGPGPAPAADGAAVGGVFRPSVMPSGFRGGPPRPSRVQVWEPGCDAAARTSVFKVTWEPAIVDGRPWPKYWVYGANCPSAPRVFGCCEGVVHGCPGGLRTAMVKADYGDVEPGVHSAEVSSLHSVTNRTVRVEACRW